MRHIVSMASVLVFVGCSTPAIPPQPMATAITADLSLPEASHGTRLDFEGQFILSLKQSEHSHARVRLVSVGYQGGTVIQHLDTHRYLAALPGDFFVSDEFGTNRLRLLSASQERQEASFAFKWTEWR
jgi:hypothetical protein